MDTIIVNGATYWLPESTADVETLVNEAIANNEIISVRGSGHSFPLIGATEKEQKSSSGRPYKYIMLSKMYAVNIRADEGLVEVQAGCHLGIDPFDPTGISTVENSLCYILDQQGFSLPDLGGITHQTIGGFLSTGSSGGSTKYSFEEALLSVDIVGYDATQGCAYTSTYEINNDPEHFFAMGLASMGLMGIIVSAIFTTSKQFYIEGSETIEYTDKCSLINLFWDWNSKLPNLQAFLEQTEYTRLMWWPQHNSEYQGGQQELSRMVVWQAKRTDKNGAKAWADHAYDLMGLPPSSDGLKPYQEVPYIFGSPAPANVVANLIYNAIGQWPSWLQKLLADKPTEYEIIKTLVENNYATKIFPAIMDLFVAVDTPTNKNKGPQLFSDIWYKGIPMDNQMNDKLMPVWFTELWIDISQTEMVMKLLKGYYDSQPITIDLSFSCEIYAAKKSPFWLSPAYGHDVIRIDIFWYGNNQGDPATFYQNFWDLLADCNYRPHWGKYIPDTVNGASGATYLSGLYPKWKDWMRLREDRDPFGIFLTDYWGKKLGIPLS